MVDDEPSFIHEAALENEGLTPIAGVDEAGRGPWAGPVVAAAVILDKNTPIRGITDSKKLAKVRRERLYHSIQQTAIVGVGLATVEEIDSLNILSATLLAMTRALEALTIKPAAVLVDGNKAPKLAIPAKPIVRGDALSLSIAAASIIAKVTRDQIMKELADAHPEYGWDRNAGYGTAEHQAGLLNHGPTCHHRRTFAPVRNALENLKRY